METKEELRIVSEQLQCAAAQKYHLQEKLCRFEVLHQQKYYVILITIIILVHNYVIHNHEKNVIRTCILLSVMLLMECSLMPAG